MLYPCNSFPEHFEREREAYLAAIVILIVYEIFEGIRVCV